ncbi:MAG: ABC transporter ATP-binding protein [Steroidobacteraceae bacterium]
MKASPTLSCAALDIAVHECVLVEQLNLQFEPGSITAVLGRNGTGKSLTLHTLAGLRKPSNGSVLLNQQVLTTQSRRDLAKQLSFVAQDIEEPFPVTTLEYALSGRHPHIDFWHWETAQDHDIARTALADMDLQHFAQRSIETLSGGERRRLAIATALTQQTSILILDEPTNHLDPQHQLQVLKLLRKLADAGGTIIMSLHDPNLATRFADHALLLFGNSQWLHGAVNDIVSADNLSRLYRTPMHELQSEHGRHFIGT